MELPSGSRAEDMVMQMRCDCGDQARRQFLATGGNMGRRFAVSGGEKQCQWQPVVAQNTAVLGFRGVHFKKRLMHRTQIYVVSAVLTTKNFDDLETGKGPKGPKGSKRTENHPEKNGHTVV
jgi:hypothetical protein